MKRDNKFLSVVLILAMLLLLYFVVKVEIHKFSVMWLVFGIVCLFVAIRQVNRLRSASNDSNDDDDYEEEF